VEGGFFECDVQSGPFLTRRECESKLPDEIQKALDDYVFDFMNDKKIKVKLPADELKKLASTNSKFEEWRNVQSLGVVLTLHALVRIEPDRIAAAYRQAQAECAEIERRSVAERHLWSFGGYFSAGFLLLASVWGYLKSIWPLAESVAASCGQPSWPSYYRLPSLQLR